jgi:hypothetical protein
VTYLWALTEGSESERPMGDIRRSRTAFSEAAAHDSRHGYLHSVYFIRSARQISYAHSLMAHALQSHFGAAIRGAPTGTKCRDSRWADWVFRADLDERFVGRHRTSGSGSALGSSGGITETLRRELLLR